MMMNCLFIATIVSIVTWQTNSFAPLSSSLSIPQYQQPPSSISESTSNNEKVTPPTIKYPPLSKEEIMEMLDSVPVYAVTNGEDEEGLVLLKEPNNPNDIAYFFFSPETANQVFSPIRGKNPNASWAVTQYQLGLVWFDLYKDANPGIEYRFIPDGQNIGAARQLIEEQSKQLGVTNVPNVFEMSYNQIPVFIDQFLRIQNRNGEEQFPLYLGIQDMITTCQEAAKVTSGQYEAAVNVADLETLITQMQSESDNDFRKAIFIPPSRMSNIATQEAAEEDVLPWSTPSPSYRNNKETPQLSTPTAIDLWED